MALGHSKFYLLTLFEVAEAIAGNGTEVNKHIRTTFAGDEAETLVAVEPFDGTLDSFSHDLELLSLLRKRPEFLYFSQSGIPNVEKTPPVLELHCLTNPESVTGIGVNVYRQNIRMAEPPKIAQEEAKSVNPLIG